MNYSADNNRNKMRPTWKFNIPSLKPDMCETINWFQSINWIKLFLCTLQKEFPSVHGGKLRKMQKLSLNLSTQLKECLSAHGGELTPFRTQLFQPAHRDKREPKSKQRREAAWVLQTGWEGLVQATHMCFSLRSWKSCLDFGKKDF